MFNFEWCQVTAEECTSCHGAVMFQMDFGVGSSNFLEIPPPPNLEFPTKFQRS